MKQYLKPIHLACGDDELRPNIALIEINNNIATATDGSILVKVDLTMNNNSELTPEQLKTINGKFIHREVWKEIFKCDFLEFDDQYIICHKDSIKKLFEYSEANGAFFNTNTIVEELKFTGGEEKEYIAYSPKYIAIIHKIFQHEQMIFSFSKKNKGTVVFPFEESGMFAVLMPREATAGRYLFL